MRETLDRDELRKLFLFESLSDEHLDWLTEHGDVRTVLLVNLGHGDRTGLAPRRPRLAFDDVAAIV